MPNAQPTGDVDTRFSDSSAKPTEWSDALAVLEAAELFWITTVRADGRPHVTPLVAVVMDEEVYFCTGIREQKFKNLEHNPHVAMTTGKNTWTEGMDIVVEGKADRIMEPDALQTLADTWESKYGEVWHFDVVEGGFHSDEGGVAGVFRVDASKVMAFAKDPHAQTTFRF